MKPKLDLQLVALAVPLFCAWLARDLFNAWLHSPHDRLAWLALLLWLVPLTFRLDDRPRAKIPINIFFLIAAVLCGILGELMKLHFLAHLALALALAAWMKVAWRAVHISWRTVVWLLSAVAWMPVFGWGLAPYSESFILPLRMVVVLAGVLCPWPAARKATVSVVGGPHKSNPLKHLRSPKIPAVALLLAVILAIIWDLVPLPDAQNRLGRFAAQGLGFASREMPLSDTEKSIFGAAQVVKRVYRVGRQDFVVVIIDGARNRHAVHDPAYCIRGAGWTITGEQPLVLPGGAGTVLTLAKGPETREALFWFSDGRTRHARVARCWWQMALRRLTFGTSGPDPVLVLVQPLTNGPTDWEHLQTRLPSLFEF